MRGVPTRVAGVVLVVLLGSDGLSVAGQVSSLRDKVEEYGRSLRERLFNYGRPSDDHLRRRLFALPQSPPDDGDVRWRNVGPYSVGGRIKAVAAHPADPKTVYAGAASGGVWVSTNEGRTWDPIWKERAFTISSLCIPKGQPKWIFAATGEYTPGYRPEYPGLGVYLSRDGGGCWKLLPTRSTRIARVVVSDDGKCAYVAGNAGLEEWKDGKAAFVQISDRPVSDVAFSRTDEALLYVAVCKVGASRFDTRTSVWKDFDLWSTVEPADVKKPEWPRLAVRSNGQSDTVIVRDKDFVYRSDNSGGSFVAFPAPTAGKNSIQTWASLVAVAPHDSKLVLFGDVDLHVKRGDAPWTEGSENLEHWDFHDASWSPVSAPTHLYVASDGGVLLFDRDANHGRCVSYGLSVAQFYSIDVHRENANLVIGGTQDRGTVMTADRNVWRRARSGDGWDSAFGNSDGGARAFSMTDGSIHYVGSSGEKQIVKGGADWVTRPVAIGAGGLVFYGTAKGVHVWDPADAETYTDPPPPEMESDGAVSVIAVHPSRPILWFGTDDGLVYSGLKTDRWRSTKRVLPELSDPKILDKAVTSMTLDASGGEMIAGVKGPGDERRIVRFGPDGTDWLGSGLPDTTVNALVRVGDDIYAGTDTGVWRRRNGRWTRCQTGLPYVRVVGLAYSPSQGELLAATHGRGVFRAALLGADEPSSARLIIRDHMLDTGSSSDGEAPALFGFGELDVLKSPDIRLTHGSPKHGWTSAKFEFAYRRPFAVAKKDYEVAIQVRRADRTAVVKPDMKVSVFLYATRGDETRPPNLPAPPTGAAMDTDTWRLVGRAQYDKDSGFEHLVSTIIWTAPDEESGHVWLMAVVTGSDRDALDVESLDPVELASRSSQIALARYALKPEGTSERADTEFNRCPMAGVR